MRVLKMRAPAILLPAALALTVPARGAVGRAPEPAPAAPTTAAATYPKINPPDEYSYLENNNDPRTVAWVKAQNEKTAAALESSPEFRRNFAMTLALNDAVETPLASQRLMLKDGWVYQLWVDNEHPRGTWRRARLSSFLSASPVWQALLDVDALAAQTGRPIQLVNSAEFSPNGRRCIVRLSNGWSNIIEFREFDLEKRDFVEHGFEIPEGIAGNAVWYDADTLIVSGKFGNPDETVESGWDKVVKKWKRGTPLKDAETIFRGEPRDLGVRVEQQELPPAQLASLRAAGREAVTIMRLSFDDAGNRASGASGVLYSSWLLGQDDQPRRMATPSNVPYPRAAKDDFIFPIERDWSVGGQVWRAGSLLAIPAEDIGSATPRVQLVFRPSDEQRIANIAVAGDSIFILGSHLGSSIGWIARKTGERWSVRKVQFPQIGSAQISMVERGDVILDYQGIAQPSTYFRVDFAKGKIVPTGRHPADAGRNVNVERFEVRSADGALVPYLVARSATTRFDGQAPALVVGYGAYGGDQVPVYYPSLKR
jgi:prolyl oligopeptidase